MRIQISKIPAEGLDIEESLSPAELDINTPQIKFSQPLEFCAKVMKITNAVTVDAVLFGRMHLVCSRCLVEFEEEITRRMHLDFLLEKDQLFIELNPQIREEIIINYPIKSICKHSCKGLCPKCGKNLNEGTCTCKR